MNNMGQVCYKPYVDAAGAKNILCTDDKKKVTCRMCLDGLNQERRRTKKMK